MCARSRERPVTCASPLGSPGRWPRLRAFEERGRAFAICSAAGALALPSDLGAVAMTGPIAMATARASPRFNRAFIRFLPGNRAQARERAPLPVPKLCLIIIINLIIALLYVVDLGLSEIKL